MKNLCPNLILHPFISNWFILLSSLIVVINFFLLSSLIVVIHFFLLYSLIAVIHFFPTLQNCYINCFFKDLKNFKSIKLIIIIKKINLYEPR